MAGRLAARGVAAVVFEQHARPYGKIEDGLPRWHVKLRHKEYEIIDRNLDQPLVHFVPLTRIGRDVDFVALAREWGFSLVVMATGAWHDRPLPIDGADDYVGRGLTYQNAFIHWFNHYEESTYDGPAYEVRPGTVVIGGGLASIDVAKALQIEVVRQELRRRGVTTSVEDLELRGIPDSLAEHGLSWEGLGLPAAAIYYRRRIEDMPLLDLPAGADEKRRLHVEATRRRLVEKAMRRFCFDVRPLRAPVDMIVRQDRLVGLRLQHTRLADGRLHMVEGAVETVEAPEFISSIGSVPEPIRGVPQKGELYDLSDFDLGRLAGFDNVFCIGNVVTGKGNILVSRKHSADAADVLLEQFLGVGATGDHAGEEDLYSQCRTPIAATSERIHQLLLRREPLAPEQVEGVLRRVADRQHKVGYLGSFADWIARARPADMA